VLGTREELTVFRSLDKQNRWQGPFCGSPVRGAAADGKAIIRALQDAKANPVERPLGRLGKSHAKAVTQHAVSDDMVAVPEDDESETFEKADRVGTVHAEIQYLLGQARRGHGLRGPRRRQ
jgi:hypothetical protein